MNRYSRTYDKARTLARQIITLMKPAVGDVPIDDFPELQAFIEIDPSAVELLESLSDKDILVNNLRDFRRHLGKSDSRLLLSRLRRRKTIRKRIRLFSVASCACIILTLIGVFVWHSDAPSAEPSKGFSVPTLVLETGESYPLGGSSTEDVLLTSGIAYADHSELVSRADQTAEEEVGIHKIFIPQEWTYQVVLPDGTRVHLNAGSELHYPVRFSGDSRQVYFKGEAYFEVAADQRPFLVLTEDCRLRVYGTQFNINTSKPEFSETFLVTGQVGVSASGIEEIILQPGELLLMGKQGQTPRIIPVDPENYLSWRRGMFSYELAELEHIILDISQWYGIGFDFGEPAFKNRKISLSAERNTGLKELLELLQAAARVNINRQNDGTYRIE